MGGLTNAPTRSFQKVEIRTGGKLPPPTATGASGHRPADRASETRRVQTGPAVTIAALAVNATSRVVYFYYQPVPQVRQQSKFARPFFAKTADFSIRYAE